MNDIQIVLKLVVSALLSGFIGLERQIHRRAAGLRTHILVSVGEMINNIEVIKAEVEFVKIYKDQFLFHDISKFVYNHGFELIDLQWTEPCRRFHARSDLEGNNYRLIWADAVYARRIYDFNKPRLLPQAIILGEMGYRDLAIYQIRNSPKLNENEKNILEKYFSTMHSTTLKGKIKDFLKKKFSLKLERCLPNNKQVLSLRDKLHK